MARHINLLDPPKKIRPPFATALQMGVPIALVLLVMATWGAVVRFHVSAEKQKLNEIEAQIRPINEQLSQLQTGMNIEQLNTNLREKLQRAEAQLKARKDIQTALRRGDLGSTQGFSEFMRAFAHQTVSGLWLTGLKLENGGRDITLTGRALTADAVATFVRQLRAEPALKGRDIATLRVAPLPPAESADQASTPAAARAPALPSVYEFEISSLTPVSDAKTEEKPVDSVVDVVNDLGGAVSAMAQKVFK